jgi:very-short-patch-repair endonuclease
LLSFIKLLIELDGDAPSDYYKIEEDKIRDKYLEDLGFTVLRFENRFVFREPEYIKDEIKKVLKKKSRSKIRESTTPSRRWRDTPPSKGGEILNIQIT